MQLGTNQPLGFRQRHTIEIGDNRERNGKTDYAVAHAGGADFLWRSRRDG